MPTVMQFRGPIHFDDLTSHHLDIDKDFRGKKEVSGIYIFGFMLDQHGEFHVGKSLPASGGCQFIPYYVGKDSHLEKFKRIKDHRNLFNQDTPKIIRFSLNFLKLFYSGKYGFPISHWNNKGDKGYNQEVLNWIKRNSSKYPFAVTYCNYFESMRTIYKNDLVVRKEGFVDTKHYGAIVKGANLYKSLNLAYKNTSIHEYRIKNPRAWKRAAYPFKYILDPVPDSLADLFSAMDNFWVCYCPAERSLLDDLETAVFFALKGLTISTVKSSVDLKVMKAIKIDCPGAAIFKTPKDYRIDINNLFSTGSLAPDICATQSIFPGY